MKRLLLNFCRQIECLGRMGREIRPRLSRIGHRG